MTPAARAVLDAVREDRLTPAIARAYREECARMEAAADLDESCRVCGATPDADGITTHGRGCYVISNEGGGVTVSEPRPVGPGRKAWEPDEDV